MAVSNETVWILRYINHIVMQEDIEDKTHMLQESLDFQAKKRSFYEVLGQKYPPSPIQDNHNTHAKKIKEVGKNVESDELIIRSSNIKARGKKDAVCNEEFDDVWICTLGETDKELAAYIADLMKISASKSVQVKGPSAAKKKQRRRRAKSPKEKKEVIDLRSLLMNCAEFVAADVRGSAKELLRQVRQHSSPSGDGIQRIAHYFADALEARLDGTGSRIYKALVHERVTAASSDHMRAYCLSILTSPFRKISNFASNNLIMTKSGKAKKIHIVDFGMFYSFQWLTFMQLVGERQGGPPKLRITVIDFLQPGPGPPERIEDMVRRMVHYAKTFNVPFEYNVIAQRVETIKIKDLKIEKGEFVVVNCLYLSKNLEDDTDGKASSRNMALNLIRKINPDIFIHGIVNAAYGNPFFVSRFREALLYFSTLFDMVETTIPKETPERVLLEKDFIAKEALNVIACEGMERVERPETYKQWQARHLMAGFMLVPFGKELIDTAMYKMREFNLREFGVNEDNNWLLMSWKGRTLYALSCWQPV